MSLIVIASSTNFVSTAKSSTTGLELHKLKNNLAILLHNQWPGQEAEPYCEESALTKALSTMFSLSSVIEHHLR
jgi:hypothetical protein